MRTVIAALLLAATSYAYDVSLRMNPVSQPSPCNDSVVQYAGYFDVDDTYNSHYFAWFSESRKSPSTDPLIVWFSGGPGCSSSLAMLTENGPCTMNADGTNTDTNPYSWNNQANTMYVDQPSGVGFSYGDRGGYSHNETQVAAYMVDFFTKFYEKFPEYADNDLVLACESYGGHYCPSIAYGLFESNKNRGTNFPLKAVAIGNGLVDPVHQYPTYPDFVWNTCQEEVGRHCVDKSGYESMLQAAPKCEQLAIDCQSDLSVCADAMAFCNDAMFGPYEQTGMNVYDIRIPCEVPGLCYNFTDVQNFLNLPSTQQAIGVSDVTWSSCNMQVNGDFDDDWMRSMAWKVPVLLEGGVKVWVYAGVDDFIVQWVGNKAWTLALPWSGQQQYNSTTPQQWTSNGEVAGTHMSYGPLSFTTILGAGHMAPHDQPQRSLTMINALITDSPLPGTKFD